jgi:hypothetical protein
VLHRRALTIGSFGPTGFVLLKWQCIWGASFPWPATWQEKTALLAPFSGGEKEALRKIRFPTFHAFTKLIVAGFNRAAVADSASSLIAERILAIFPVGAGPAGWLLQASIRNEFSRA